jgi:hypothetical protein
MLIECEFLRSRNWYSAVFILLNYSNPILRRAKSLSSTVLHGGSAWACHRWRRRISGSAAAAVSGVNNPVGREMR